MVFVLDRHKHLLMPCSKKRARLLLSRRQAVIHRFEPFTIRLKERSSDASQLKTRGVHTGRVAVRASGSFRVGKVDGISARYCRLLQSCDGYSYGLVDVQAAEVPPRQPSKGSASSLLMLEKQGYPEAVV